MMGRRLVGNLVCNTQLSNSIYCRLQQRTSIPYSTNLSQCCSKACPSVHSLSPQSCNYAYPYQGSMIFRAPSFLDVTNSTLFEELEMSLWTKIKLTPGSVYLSDPFFTSDNYLELQVKLFPSTGMYFNWSEVLRIGFYLSNQTYKPPKIFGPFYFIASPYPFPGEASGKTSMSTGVVAGIELVVLFLYLDSLLWGFMPYDKREGLKEP